MFILWHREERGRPARRGGGEPAGGLPLVHICSACAQASANALKTAARTASPWPVPPLDEDEESQTFGTVVDWTPFLLDGEPWRWRATRQPSYGVGPSLQIHVRRLGAEPYATVSLEPLQAPSERLARAALPELGRPLDQIAKELGAELPPLGVVQDWATFESAGERFEWRVERIRRAYVSILLHVDVWDPKTGERRAAAHPGRAQPSVDLAVMTARMAETAPPDAPLGDPAETDSVDLPAS